MALFHKHLGKILLGLAAITWTSCGDDSSTGTDTGDDATTSSSSQDGLSSSSQDGSSSSNDPSGSNSKPESHKAKPAFNAKNIAEQYLNCPVGSNSVKNREADITRALEGTNVNQVKGAAEFNIG